MTKLKKYNTIEEWETAKSDLEYPSVGLVGNNSVVYMTPIIHKLPIKAVFYDSSTGSFVKMYPDEITEEIPTYTPIGVEVIPAEHDVYGTGQAGVMSLAEMNYTTPDVGGSEYPTIYWGGYGTKTSLPYFDEVNHVDGTTGNYGYLPSDQYTGVTSLDGVSKYENGVSGKAPSPYNADGSRNEAYYTTAYSTANVLSDFDGVGNTAVLTELATAQSDWKTASAITNSYGKYYYPAACCAWRFHTAGTVQGQWYLPAGGEFGYVINRISAINTTINKVLSVYSSVVGAPVRINSSYYWVSSDYNIISARYLLALTGWVNYADKTQGYRARAFLRL